MTVTDRRSFLRGGLALMAAPAIVRASSLMPIKAPKMVSEFLVTVRFDYGAFIDEVAMIAQIPRRLLIGQLGAIEGVAEDGPPQISAIERQRAADFFGQAVGRGCVLIAPDEYHSTAERFALS